MENWCCRGLGCICWKEAWQIKMALPCCTAFTERTEKLAPVRVRSTWYSTGTFGSPTVDIRDKVTLSKSMGPIIMTVGKQTPLFSSSVSAAVILRQGFLL